MIIVLIGSITYGLLRSGNKINDLEQSEEKKEDGVKLVSAKAYASRLIEEFEVVLNGKEHKLVVNFMGSAANENVNYGISGWYNDMQFYYEEESDNAKESLYYYEADEKFNEKNFQIIKGKDGKSYLLVLAMFLSDTNGDDRVYIFNDDLELLKSDSFKYYWCVKEPDKALIVHSYWQYVILEDEAVWYQDKYGTCVDDKYKKCHVNVKIEDNKIYYLVPVITYNGVNDFGYVEERVYELNNNRLEYEVINKYKIKQIVNSLC